VVGKGEVVLVCVIVLFALILGFLRSAVDGGGELARERERERESERVKVEA